MSPAETIGPPPSLPAEPGRVPGSAAAVRPVSSAPVAPPAPTTAAPTAPAPAPAPAPLTRPGPLQRAQAVAAATSPTLQPSAPAMLSPWGPHAPVGVLPQPVINPATEPPYTPPPGNENLPGPRAGKPAPFIGQEAGSATGAKGPEFQTRETPGRAYNTAQAYPGAQAFGKSALEGSGLIWSAIRTGDMYAEASKFAPDPTYRFDQDPQVLARPNMATAVMVSHSARETAYILRAYDQWGEENRRLAQNGISTSLGAGVGMLLDPLNYVGLEALKFPFKAFSDWNEAWGVASKGVRKPGPRIDAGPPDDFTGSGGTPGGIHASVDLGAPGANQMLADVGTQTYLGIGKSLLPKDELDAGATGLAHDTGIVDPLTPAPPTAPFGHSRAEVADFDKLKQSLITRESGGDPNISGSVTASGERAGGLMQVMPSTALDISKEMNDGNYGRLSSMSPEQIEAWLKEPSQQAQQAVTFPSIKDFGPATLVYDPARGFAIQGSNGVTMSGPPGGWFKTEADAIARVHYWDAGAQVVRKGATNSEVYGTYYLHKMLTQFDGDQNLALAAYNAGPGNVEDFMNGTNNWGNNKGLLKLGDPRKGEITSKEFVEKFPFKETRDYVADINGRAPPKYSDGGDLTTHAVDGEGSTSTLAAGEPKSPKPGDISADRTTILDANGKPVTDHGAASFVQIAPKAHSLDAVSLIDAAGGHVGGQPLAEGTPAIQMDHAHFFDSDSNPLRGPEGASTVIDTSNAVTRPYSGVKWYDAAGKELPTGEGASTLRLNPVENDPSIAANAQGDTLNAMLSSAWQNRKPLLEAAEKLGIDVPELIASRLGLPSVLTKILKKALQRAKKTKTGDAEIVRNTPGTTSYRQAQDMHGEAMQAAYGTEKPPVSPLVRLANSPSPVARNGLRQLIGSAWDAMKNQTGAALPTSAWTKMRGMLDQASQAMRDTQAQYWNYVKRMGGEAPTGANPFDPAKTPIQGVSGLMPYGQFLEEVGRAKRALGTSDAQGLVPEATAAADSWNRRVYKPLGQRADAAGIEGSHLEDEYAALQRQRSTLLQQGSLGKAAELASRIKDLEQAIKGRRTGGAAPTYRSDYLNRLYDQKALAANGDAFQRILQQHGRSPEEASAILEQLRRGQPFQNFGGDSVVRTQAMGRFALNDIPDRDIESFLTHDISKAGSAYVRQHGMDVALAENFGADDINLAKHIADIRDNYAQLMQSAPNAEARQALGKMAARDIQDTRDLRDMARGNYGSPDNPQAFTSHAVGIAKQSGLLSQTTGFLPSLALLSHTALLGGLAVTIGHPLAIFAAAIGAYKLLRNLPKTLGEASDLIGALRSGDLGHMIDTLGNSEMVEHLTHVISSTVPGLDGLEHAQRLVKGLTSLYSGTEIINALQRFAAGKATAEDITNLIKSGFAKAGRKELDSGMVERMIEQYREHGIRIGNITIANTDQWQDPGAAQLFQWVLAHEMTSAAGEGGTPNWMPKDVQDVLGHFRNYVYQGIHRSLLPGQPQRDRQFLVGAVSQMGLGLMSSRFLAQGKGQDAAWEAKPWRDKMEEALRRSGLNGWNMDTANAMDGLSYGGTGLRPSLGVGGQGDLAHATGQLVGPIGSPATNLMNSIFANPADPWTRSIQTRFVPLHTIRQTHALMNWVAQEKNFKGQGPPFER